MSRLPASMHFSPRRFVGYDHVFVSPTSGVLLSVPDLRGEFQARRSNKSDINQIFLSRPSRNGGNGKRRRSASKRMG